MKRKLASLAVVLALGLGVVVTRAMWQGRAALAAGDDAIAAGRPDEAIRQWRRAARWYVPFASHVGEAYDRLEALAAEAEQHGDTRTALDAWQGVRGSILATRSFYTPFAERLDPANQHLAALMARVEGAAADPAHDAAARQTWHYDLLSRDEAPAVGWTVLALAGFALWIGGGFLFAWRAVGPDDRLVPRAAGTAGLVIAGGLVVWLVGLYNA